jgi:hypothetical protein
MRFALAPEKSPFVRPFDALVDFLQKTTGGTATLQV